MTRTRVPAEDLIQAAAHFVGECQDAAFLVARDGTIVAWNTRAAELFGIPAWEASAHNCAKLVRGRSADGAPLCSTNCPLLAGLAEPVPGPVPICVGYGSRGSGRAVNVQHVPIKNPLRGTTIAMVHLVDPVA
ncbi:MAG TPA: PAS domain-containing protein [Candidatus Dormibacteraeota bacterium]|jgi:PAS domain-containing protein